MRYLRPLLFAATAAPLVCLAPFTSAAGQTAAAPAASTGRAVLYEQVKKDPAGRRFVGSVLWRLEKISPGPGLPPELTIRADVEVPERRFAMTMSIRRNADPALSTSSHTIEIIFNLPAGFIGSVAKVPGLLIKEQEDGRGVALAGLGVKVTKDFFLVGLSAKEVDRRQNSQLMQSGAWIDVPIVYASGLKAILAIEKGETGKTAFADANLFPRMASFSPKECQPPPTIGMTQAEADGICWGKPENTSRITSTAGVRESWYYGFGRLEFQDGRLIEIHERN